MKIDYYAIGIGGTVNIGGSALVGSVIIWIYSMLIITPEMDQVEIFRGIYYSPFVVIISFIVGCFFNFFGGYVSAQIANSSYLTYGGLSSIPCIVVTFIGLTTPLGAIYSAWYYYLGMFLAVIFGIFGGYIYRRHITNHST